MSDTETELPPEETEPEDSGKTFSQAEVNRIMTREKDQGKRSGRREVLDTLGVKTLEEAQGFLKTLQDADAAKLSDAEKAKADAEAERKAAAVERQEAKQDRFQARLERQLTAAGVEDAYIQKVSRLVDCDVESSEDEVTASVAELKASMPQLFAPAKPEPKAPSSDPGKASSKKSESGSMDRANARLLERHGARLNQTN